MRPKILAVADSYEAMTCDRVYRRAMPATAARDELRCCAGALYTDVCWGLPAKVADCPLASPTKSPRNIAKYGIPATKRLI